MPLVDFRTFLVAGLLVGFISFATCLFVILLSRHNARIAGRTHDLNAVQASHRRITPRIGGVGIFLGLLFAFAFVPLKLSGTYASFMAATTILFCVALAEDLGWHMPARVRLLAVALASLAVTIMLGFWIPRLDIPIIDILVAHWAFGVPLTLLIISGIANGFNLIDGVNGLAGMTALVSAICLAYIARGAGYEQMVLLTSLLAAGILGFLVLNYPFGLIFLGDAGAYTLGFVLSWFGVAILLESAAVSPWAILLTMFWPVADTLLAIYRRVKRSRGAMQADRLHVHQLVMRVLEVHVLGRKRRHVANPMTTLVLSPLIAIPPVMGVLLWDKGWLAFMAFFACLSVVFLLYFRAVEIISSKLFARWIDQT